MVVIGWNSDPNSSPSRLDDSPMRHGGFNFSRFWCVSRLEVSETVRRRHQAKIYPEPTLATAVIKRRFLFKRVVARNPPPNVGFPSGTADRVSWQGTRQTAESDDRCPTRDRLFPTPNGPSACSRPNDRSQAVIAFAPTYLLGKCLVERDW
jgi:hypothetical protein